ncbi:MAG: Clp protease ClpP [Acidobacteria bacterium]|nr:Clp protease ClpP [Acidobacteriota bacterium]
MGIYSEYLDRQLSFPDLTGERKKQLRRISELRSGRDVLVFAADLNKTNAPTQIGYADLLPIGDQLENLKSTALDLILETPGGSGEVAEDIVRLLRRKYEQIAVIVPGWAKSAGTIIVMSGDEILMDHASAVGPIDAQLYWQGKVFSADALLEGMEKIKREVEETGTLNRAYIPILQGISPGELQSAENALKFSKILVTDWLARYKFKYWEKHSSTSQLVTEQEKRGRAEEIANELCDHRKWLTHGRSIKLEDLGSMGLQVVDYSDDTKLADAIRRYYTLLQMTFATNIYKVFETPESQIYRFLIPQGTPVPTPQKGLGDVAIIEVGCGKCNVTSRIQANLDKPAPLQQGCLPFPGDNRFHCPNCGNEIDLSDLRRQIESQAKKRVII